MSAESFWRRAVRKPALWIVLVFVTLFVWGSIREAHAAEINGLVGVGFGTGHSRNLIAEEVLLEINQDWDLGVARLGSSPILEDTYVAIAARRVDWREGKAFEPFLSFGVAYFDNVPRALVNDHLTFTLQAGFRWRGAIDLAWIHYSTAGRSDPNTGIDYATLRAVLRIK